MLIIEKGKNDFYLQSSFSYSADVKPIINKDQFEFSYCKEVHAHEHSLHMCILWSPCVNQGNWSWSIKLKIKWFCYCWIMYTICQGSNYSLDNSKIQSCLPTLSIFQPNQRHSLLSSSQTAMSSQQKWAPKASSSPTSKMLLDAFNLINLENGLKLPS